MQLHYKDYAAVPGANNHDGFMVLAGITVLVVVLWPAVKNFFRRYK